MYITSPYLDIFTHFYKHASEIDFHEYTRMSNHKISVEPSKILFTSYL